MIGDVGARFDDAAARGARGVVPGEDGEIVGAPLIHVARRTVDDDAGDASQFCAERKVAAPARGVEPGPLLDDDDVAGLRGFDGGGAQVPRRGPPVVLFQLDGYGTSRIRRSVEKR